MKTNFGSALDPNNVLDYYPRPQLKRDSFLNLNGYWYYTISKSKTSEDFNKKILVPFSPEAPLSEANHILQPDEFLIYYKKIELPHDFNKGRLHLHFGAVDQVSEIYINNNFVYKNIGGYLPFSIDITPYVDGFTFEIKVIVSDVTDTSYHLTGKQRLYPGGIFYTPQSGIWQTVWLESVPTEYIKDLKMTTNIDEVSIEFDIDRTENGVVDVEVYFENRLVGKKTTWDKTFKVYLDERHLWHPHHPNLYDIKISFKDDKIKSYIGLRKVETKLYKGKMYVYLNHEPILLNGLLDQGYFPDGLLTPPTYEAIKDDILYMKSLGFNTIRKHIKVEPYYFYEQCDRIGMLVIQDMINGGIIKNMVAHHVLNIFGVHINDKRYSLFGRKDEIGRSLFINDLKKMIDYLKNVTSIIVWVPFNEAWGQFDSKSVYELIKKQDPTRLVDHASGWADQKIGDFHSRHVYFVPIRFKEKHAKKRVLALTEFGGFSLPIKNHHYNPNKVFGYKKFYEVNHLKQAYQKLYLESILPEIKKGLSVLIYTQLSDVEDEINGLITYDRKVKKMETSFVYEINMQLYDAFSLNFKE